MLNRLLSLGELPAPAFQGCWVTNSLGHVEFLLMDAYNPSGFFAKGTNWLVRGHQNKRGGGGAGNHRMNISVVKDSLFNQRYK